MLIPLEYAVALAATLGTGFTIGFHVGRKYQPTITLRPNLICPRLKKISPPDNKDWCHTCLIYENGTLAAVECDRLTGKTCGLSSGRCHYLPSFFSRP